MFSYVRTCPLFCSKSAARVLGQVAIPEANLSLASAGHPFPAAFGLEDTRQIGESYGSPIARTLRLHRQLPPAHNPRGAEETTATPFGEPSLPLFLLF